MVYLNNAATTFPKPPSVVEAVNAYNKLPPIQPGRSDSVEGEVDIALECRENLCQLFNIALPEDIIFTSSATYSLNLILRGLLKTGDHVVTTMVEHNSVLRVLKTLEKTHALTLSIVGCDRRGYVSPADIQSHITSSTKAVVVNHCSNVTGCIQDLESIGDIARNASAYFIVDGAQSGGSIEVDLRQVFVDAFVFAGHKSLFGMQGSGGLYLRSELHPEPLIVGGTGVKSDYLYQPPGRPTYYEAGTPNMPGIVSLNAGVTYVLNEGIASISAKKATLRDMVLEGLLNNSSVIVYGGSELSDFRHNDAIVSFNIKDMPPDDTAYILNRSFGIVCRSGLHCAPLIHQPIGSSPNGCVRTSFSCFNERKDAEALLDAVDDITTTKRTT